MGMGSDTGQIGGAERIQAALDGDLARVLARQAEGKPLSSRDRKLLETELDRRRGGEQQLELPDQGPVAPAGREPVLPGIGPGPLKFKGIAEAAGLYGYSIRQIKN